MVSSGGFLKKKLNEDQNNNKGGVAGEAGEKWENCKEKSLWLPVPVEVLGGLSLSFLPEKELRLQ
jgi:hypothetical protein